jgi:hypothetical protein
MGVKLGLSHKGKKISSGCSKNKAQREVHVPMMKTIGEWRLHEEKCKGEVVIISLPMPCRYMRGEESHNSTHS